MTLRHLLYVFIGSGLGGTLRYGVNLWGARTFSGSFPVATFTVNVVGAFLMGLIAGWLAFKSQMSWSTDLRLFLTTGILGGFTTFSAFSLDAMTLIERGEWGLAGIYMLSSVALSVLALALGLAIIRGLA